MLPDDALRWSSSIDGELGAGPEIETRDLTAGRHVVTLTATDSAGNTAAASVELVVDGAVRAGRPSEALATTIGSILERFAAGEDPAPAVGDHPDFLWDPMRLTVTAAVLLGIALYGLRRLRAGPTAAAGAPKLTEWVAHGNSVGPPPQPDQHELEHVVQQGAPPGAEAAGAGGGSNELSLDDTAGGDDVEVGDGDMAMKGKKILDD